jgi:hypothetical protein
VDIAVYVDAYVKNPRALIFIRLLVCFQPYCSMISLPNQPDRGITNGITRPVTSSSSSRRRCRARAVTGRMGTDVPCFVPPSSTMSGMQRTMARVPVGDVERTPPTQPNSDSSAISSRADLNRVARRWNG